MEKLLNTVEFKEVEDLFRYKKPSKKKEKEPEQEERVYGYSYDKFLQEEYLDIGSVEEDILRYGTNAREFVEKYLGQIHSIMKRMKRQESVQS